MQKPPRLLQNMSLQEKVNKSILFSPWRMDYVTSPTKGENIFISKQASSNDRKSLILFRGNTSFILMNLYPYNNGHLLIAPYDKYNDISKLDFNIFSEIIYLVQASIGILKIELKAEGFNVGFNMGKSAGAAIDEHLHLHIVPRWTGDSNFMPIVGQTKVIVQGLLDTYDLLKPKFDKVTPFEKI